MSDKELMITKGKNIMVISDGSKQFIICRYSDFNTVDTTVDRASEEFGMPRDSLVRQMKEAYILFRGPQHIDKDIPMSLTKGHKRP